MNPKNQTFIIVWGALASSHLFHLVMGELRVAETQEPDMTIIAAICLAGLSTLFVSLMVIPKALKVHTPAQLPTVFIVQWALLESTGICGLVARFMGAEGYVQYGMAALAMTGMLFTFPSKKIQEELIRRGAE